MRSAKADTRRIGVSKKHKNHGGNNTAMIDKLGSVTIPSNPSETNTKAKADEKSKYFTSSM